MSGRHRGNDICPDDGQPIEERHLVAAVVFGAYVVEKYGEVYMPMLDRVEHELNELRRRGSPRDRARRILEAYTLDGGTKAIS